MGLLEVVRGPEGGDSEVGQVEVVGYAAVSSPLRAFLAEEITLALFACC